MSTTGLDDFDKTLEASHAWLIEIGEAIGPDTQRCYHALRAVLTTLRDRLPIDQSALLAAELPLLIRGVFYDGFRPADVPLPLRRQDEFVTLVAKRFGNIGPVSPRASTIAVFRVLQRHLSRPLLATLKTSLPQEIRALFQPEPAADAPGPHRDDAPSRSATGESPSRDWGTALSGQESDPHIRPDKLS